MHCCHASGNNHDPEGRILSGEKDNSTFFFKDELDVLRSKIKSDDEIVNVLKKCKNPKVKMGSKGSLQLAGFACGQEIFHLHQQKRHQKEGPIFRMTHQQQKHNANMSNSPMPTQH